MSEEHVDEELLRAVEQQLGEEARAFVAETQAAAPLEWLRRERRRRRRNRVVLQSTVTTAGVVLLSVLAMNWTRLFRAAAPEEIPPVAQAERPREPAASVVKPVSDSSSASGATVGAIPILRVETQPNGEYKFTPGWYVPERVRPVDPRQLSPAERSAVSRLLGEELETPEDQVI